jgi:hypothetical protein
VSNVLILNSLPRTPPIWLYVQSTSITATQRAITALPFISDLQSSLPPELLTSSPNLLKKKASSDLTPVATCKKKKKRVQFIDSATSNNVNATITASPAVTQLIPPEFNLCLTKNICHYLQRNYRVCSDNSTDICLGYLETPCQMYKHKFYLRDKRIAANKPSGVQDINTVLSIFDIMRQDPDDFLQQEDQLRLAHRAALAILQYNDTPWFAARWRLGDLSYFGTHQKFDETTLKTLHLSSQITSPTQNNSGTGAMEGITETTVSDEIRYGINNLPLFFLGVALLEIAHWKPLESKMIPQDQKDQVFTARRLALGRAPLGPEYQKIAQKCLQCNFGFGTKLNSKSLQTAVYNDVVCELENMIGRLVV